MYQSQIQEVQLSIDGAKRLLALSEALDRLQNNRDYKLVIDEAYTQDEVFRLTGMLSEVTDSRNATSALGGISKESIVDQLSAVAHFSAFLRNLRHKTEGIGASLAAYEEEQELLRREAAGE